MHGLTLFEAQEELFWKLEEIIITEDNILKVNHGFNRGQVIKNYLRSKNFTIDTVRYRLKVEIKIDPKNQGITFIKLIKDKKGR